MRAVSRALMVLEPRAPSALGRHGDVSLGLAAQAIILSALRASSFLYSEPDSKIRQTPRVKYRLFAKRAPFGQRLRQLEQKKGGFSYRDVYLDGCEHSPHSPFSIHEVRCTCSAL